jgi:hypothetical protein
VIALKKFAPMGSALCFPIETMIFAAICEYVTRGHCVRGDYSVYGDDIIVPTQCAGQLMRLLTTLGFYVNTEKSFYQQENWFRESCGSEFCDGFDVTPMRVSRKYAHKTMDVRIEQYVDLANRAYERGYLNLRAFFLRKLRSTQYVPLFAPNAVLSENYTNFHTERRWNLDLQRIDAKVSYFVPIYPKKTDESLRLHHWLESTENRTSVYMPFVSEIGRPTMKFKSRWSEKPYESLDQGFIDYFTARG